MGIVTGPCSVNYALSAMILTAAKITNPDYVIQTYHIYLLLLALLIVEGLLTMNSTRFIGQLNKFGTIVNFLVVFIFIIWMPVGSINMPKTNPNSEVWTSKGIVNGTEWPTAFAVMMGFLSVIVSPSAPTLRQRCELRDRTPPALRPHLRGTPPGWKTWFLIIRSGQCQDTTLLFT